MSHVGNKLILLLIASLLAWGGSMTGELVFAVLLALVCACATELITQRSFRIVVFGAGALGAFFFPPLHLFLPVLYYELVRDRLWILGILCVVPFTEQSYTAVMLIGIAVFLRLGADRYVRMEKEFHRQRDDLTEQSISLEEKLNTLTQRQDYEIHLATLGERARIAHEIHDNVGHVLSRSILQVGALLISTREGPEKENLLVLKDNLVSGMDSIRASIHDLHDDSVDVHAQLTELAHSFTFCALTLDDGVESPLPIKARYAVLAVVKEALSNIIRHSDATDASIRFIEHPRLYQLIIFDNGSKRPSPAGLESGMGLESIRRRVAALGGHCNITAEAGFRIFISFPKERTVYAHESACDR